MVKLARNEYPICITSNPYRTEIFNLNFQSLEVVSRYRDTQL